MKDLMNQGQGASFSIFRDFYFLPLAYNLCQYFYKQKGNQNTCKSSHV